MKENKVIYHVDAFTNEAFRGNPAGVCILDSEPSGEWMQNIAMELNLSETAFVFPGTEGRQIRFFSPSSEVKLCGHATLSASHIMFEQGFAKKGETLVFNSKAGRLSVSHDDGWITLNFPLYEVDRMEYTPDFEKVTGVKAIELYTSSFGWTLALLGSEEEVKTLSPDFRAMKSSPFGDLIVTAPAAGKDYDFCVRCFAPALGIDEDPVTGSAHCALLPFWKSKTGKEQFVSHQVSGRGGILRVAIVNGRAEISGQAKTILRSELFI
ncbi:MAG: PhzF family phenazine biosynthesis protein [Bacteroidales bacterium]